MTTLPPRPNPHAIEQPTHPGNWWFAGWAVRGLTRTRVQNRPLEVDDDLIAYDANTGQLVEAQLVGWWTEADKMGV